MKCLILAAGYATRLYPLTENFPKPLLKVGEKAILDHLIDDLDTAGVIDEYVVISNHKFAHHFESWAKEHTDIEIHLEQLLVYFLFTYFPGAVYDGEVYSKVQMAVYCTWMIHELWMAKWLKNEKSLDLEEMTDLVYRFSREVEHSDENLIRIDKMMRKKCFLLGGTKDGV